MNFKELSIHNLDFDKYTDFQRLVFKPLLDKVGFNALILNKEEFLWKYKGAWKEGIIYVVEEDNSLIGSSAIVPYLMEDYLKNQFWCVQVFDNAVDRNYRKKNVFFEVYDRTYNNKYGYTCFGFPNENAITTGLKFNGHIKDEIYFWVKPKLGLPFKKDNKRIQISLIKDSSQLPNFAPYIPSLSVRKDKNYIQWRYFNRPNRNYRIYKVSAQNEEGFSFVILTTITYQGFMIHLVLDTVGSNEYYYKNGLRLFMNEIDKSGIFVALTNDSAQMKTAGFFKIPPSFAPKRHYLVYTERVDTPFQVKSLTWHSSMGDWEVF